METSEIFELLDKFDKSTLSEVIITQGDQRVTLRKAVAPAELHAPAGPLYPHLPPHHGAPAHPQAAESTAGGQEAPAADVEVITSPIVGTFYRAPSPDSPPFMEPGQRATKGQTLCVIEAMKVMNELQAEFDCEIVDVLVENGSMIEFGTPLFEVKR